MSHFSRIKTQMIEKEHLLQAITDAGYSYDVGENLKLGGFGGQKTPIEIKVHSGLLSGDIGFHKNKDAYECIADWWGVRGVKKEEFIQRITQRYAYHAACAKLEAQGFTLINEEIEEGERIHLRLRRMV